MARSTDRRIALLLVAGCGSIFLRGGQPSYCPYVIRRETLKPNSTTISMSSLQAASSGRGGGGGRGNNNSGGGGRGNNNNNQHGRGGGRGGGGYQYQQQQPQQGRGSMQMPGNSRGGGVGMWQPSGAAGQPTTAAGAALAGMASSMGPPGGGQPMYPGQMPPPQYGMQYAPPPQYAQPGMPGGELLITCMMVSFFLCMMVFLPVHVRGIWVCLLVWCCITRINHNIMYCDEMLMLAQ